MLWEIQLIAMFCLSVLVLWPLQNAIHEGSHAAAHEWLGDKVTRLLLYPTNAAGEPSLSFWKEGFTWAYMTYDRDPERIVRPFTEGLASALPQLVNTAFLLCLLPPLFLIDFGPVERSAITALCVTNYVDGAWNLGTFYRLKPKPSTDGWRWAKHWGLGTVAPRLLAVAWHVGFGSLLFYPW